MGKRGRRGKPNRISNATSQFDGSTTIFSPNTKASRFCICPSKTMHHFQERRVARPTGDLRIRVFALLRLLKLVLQRLHHTLQFGP